MSTYFGTSRTNYFRVTDEEKYQKLLDGLSAGEAEINHFAKEHDGMLYHCFAAHNSIDFIVGYEDDETPEYNIDAFFEGLQEILPENEACILTEAGHEKFAYVGCNITLCTKHKISYFYSESWAQEEAKKILGGGYKVKQHIY